MTCNECRNLMNGGNVVKCSKGGVVVKHTYHSKEGENIIYRCGNDRGCDCFAEKVAEPAVVTTEQPVVEQTVVETVVEKPVSKKKAKRRS